MALTIDSLNLICTVDQFDMLDVTGGSPSEIRELNIDAFRKEWGDLLDNEEYVSLPWPFIWTQPKLSTGITYAPFLDVINGWTVQFSNGAYNVNIVGGNSNMGDVIIKNTVGINTANSAGLQDSTSLQAGAFDGHVTIDVISGVSGTTFPRGTDRTPSDNLLDALAIAIAQGLTRFRLINSMTIDTGTDLSAGYTFYSDRLGVIATIDPAANVSNCSFETLAVTGVLDSNNGFISCEVFNATSLQATLTNCLITGTITLGAGLTKLINCSSGEPGGGPTDYPSIDMGVAGQDLLVRRFSGSLGIENLDDATTKISLDFDSGRLIAESDVIDGTITVRGIADVIDNSTGTAVVTDLTLSKAVDGVPNKVIPHIWGSS